MQVIYGPGNASNIQFTAQKRLIRPTYAQTQGFPYACSLDPSFRNADSSFRLPLAADTAPPYPLARALGPFTLQGSIVPGSVMVKSGGTGEYVCLHNGSTVAAVQPFGLLGQWLGGTFDNIGQSNQVGVWMGPDSTYTLLAPAWNDTSVATQFAAATAGSAIPLYSGTDSRLYYTAAPGSAVAVARVIDRPSSAQLVIQMIV